MAEGDGFLYNNFKEQIMEKIFDLSTGGDTLKLAMVTAYTPNIDTHTQWGDAGVSSTEVSGTGYTAGGETLANQDTVQNDTSDRGEFDADDVTWTGLDVGTPSHVILYDDSLVATPVDGLIAYWEVTTATNGGNYTIQWAATGIILLT